MKYLPLLLIVFLLTGCEDIRTAYWINIKNETEFPIGIIYKTENEKLSTKILNSKNEDNSQNYITIFHESYCEGNVEKYSQNEFENKIHTLNIFRVNETGDTIWYSKNDTNYLSLNKWKYRYGWDDQEDYHEYWLNITNNLLTED